MQAWVSNEIQVQMKPKKGNRVNYNLDLNDSKQETAGSLSHRTNKSILTAKTKTMETQSVGTKSNVSEKSYNQNLKNEFINKNGKLVDYIKYDSTLGRDQNIANNTNSSLSNDDILKRLKGGVTIKTFAPTKEAIRSRNQESRSTTPQKFNSFEEKMAARAVELGHQQVIVNASGGNYKSER